MDRKKLAHAGVVVTGAVSEEFSKVITSDSLLFVSLLHRKFDHSRRYLLQKREEIQEGIREGNYPSFPKNDIRSKEWKVDPVPAILADRKVDVVCLNAADVKTLWECMDSDACGIQVDFDDGYSPTWMNGLKAQSNLIKAVNNQLLYNGKTPKNKALLITRPRSLNLNESHVMVDGHPIAGAFFDFGIFWFHNAITLFKSGRGPFFYLPKLENSDEAQLWDDIFVFAQQQFNIPIGTVKAIVLIENILASYEMEEILYSLRRHSLGLNAGRWDYIFSFIKKFSSDPEFVLHERSKLGLDQPFLYNYYKLLVHTCHSRGAHATGGMAPHVPPTDDPKVIETLIKQVEEGKKGEAKLGCDGALVAHPSMVSACRNIFNLSFDDSSSPNRISSFDPKFNMSAFDLIDINKPKGIEVSLKGVKGATRVLIIYIYNWLKGKGAVVLDNIVEDIATCEISRSLLWQWIQHGITCDEGDLITSDFVERLIIEVIEEEMKRDAHLNERGLKHAGELALAIVSAAEFIDFLPSLLYPFITTHTPHSKL